MSNPPHIQSVEAYTQQREEETGKNRTPKPRATPNVNYTSFVNNGTADCNPEDYDGKNEVKEIKVFDEQGNPVKYGQKITNNHEYTYEVVAFEKDPQEKDLRSVRWYFWLPNVKGLEFKKKPATIICTKNSKDSTEDFLYKDNYKDDKERIKTIRANAIVYAKKEVIEKDGEKTAVLRVKFSKWLDGEMIKVVAYLNIENKKESGDPVASRKLQTTPQIVKACWLNAAGKVIHSAGYKQDIYLYLKTLGLQGKTIEVQVFDEDRYPNPVPLTGRDDRIEWKNNKIKIEKRDAIKQFKVGDKARYKEAQEDEADQELFTTYIKDIYDLELYIHIANSEALNIKDVQYKYGRFLRLTPDEKIVTAFFAQTQQAEVQADATQKKNQTPTTEVPYYKEINEGVVGQKVQLVAECTNLEGKEVTFTIYEKEPLLVEKDTALPVLQDDKEVTEIKAKVANGFAEAEINLRQKSDDAFKKWLTILKIDGKPEDRKKTHFWIKTQIKDVDIPVKKDFLKRNTFQVISTNWHEPVDDPQIALWNSEGVEKPESNTFGTGRWRLHTGLDIFALEGSDAYASLDAIVYEQKKHGGYGHTITLKINNPQELANRRREYTRAYTTDLDSGSKFEENEHPIYLFYAHLQDVFVKKGQKVKAGDLIGLTGISGISKGTHDPHLHFNVFSTIYAIGKEKYKRDYLADPAYYVYWKTETELTTADKKIQEDRMKKGKLKNVNPVLSIK